MYGEFAGLNVVYIVSGITPVDILDKICEDLS